MSTSSNPAPLAPRPGPVPLARSLGALGVLFLTLSVTTPASSLFVIVPGIVAAAGTGALWAMLIAGLVCVATAYIYAELSSAFPNAGGEYVMVARTLGPLPGFVVLVVNIVSNILFPPVVGLGTSAILAKLVPGLPVVPVAVALVAGSTLCALLHVRVNALVTGVFLLLELATLAVVTGLGLAHPLRALAPMLLRPVMPGGAMPAPATPAAIGIATTIAIFALNGYGMSVYFAEEMVDAPRRIARVILVAFLIGFLAQLVPLAAALAGAADLAGFLGAADPFGGFVRARGGAAVAAAVALGVVAAIVNAAIAAVLAAARFLYATARDGVWGAAADRALGRVHQRFGSPWVATLAVGLAGIACCFLSLEYLLVLSGGTLILTYAAISLAALAGRRGGATAHGPYRMPLFPAAPIVTLLALGYVTWTNWLDPDEGRPGIVAVGAQAVVAAGYYLLVLRRRGRWEVSDPPLQGEVAGEA